LRQVLGRLATKMEVLLGGAVLASSINNARAGEGGTIQAIRSLHQVRGFLSSPVMLLLMDAPLSPLYFGVIFLVHRDLGFIAVVSGLALAVIAVINQKATSERLGQAALHAEITGGMMIAASIIAGRALQPLEGLIEGWRSCVQARSAYARVQQAVESFQRETLKLRLPKPQGRLTVDRVLYMPPGSKEPV